MSFFDRLRTGVQHIEQEVKQLKQMTDYSYQRTADQLAEDLTKAKQFDSNVRTTYVEVTQLYNTIRGSDQPLSDVRNRIDALKSQLIDIEDNSGIKRYGYQPFAEQYSQEDDNVFVDESDGHSGRQLTATYCPTVSAADEESNDENTVNPKSLLESDDKIGHKSCSSGGERTTQTVRFTGNAAIDGNRNAHKDNTKTANFGADRPVTQRYDKLLTRTPQPYDFGITRRFTLLPQLYNQQNNDNNRSHVKSKPMVDNELSYDTTQTCRFNYINNNGFKLNLGSAADPATPPNPSITSASNPYTNNNNNADSFVTVEFTPGLTTKRPKGVSRVRSANDNNNHVLFNESKQPSGVANAGLHKRLPQSVLQSVENDKITPEQPIPAINTDKSVQMLRLIAGKGGSTGTPPPPKSRVDAHFHHQILNNL